MGMAMSLSLHEMVTKVVGSLTASIGSKHADDRENHRLTH
jgi:hypothetical protein